MFYLICFLSYDVHVWIVSFWTSFGFLIQSVTLHIFMPSLYHFDQYWFSDIIPYSTLSSPTLYSPPVNLEESRSLKKFSTNFFLEKICLRTNFELNLLFIFCFFLFKYDAVIIKQPSSCTFDKKSCKILENFRKF